MTEPRKNSPPPEPETPEEARAKIRSGQGYGLSDVILAYAEYANRFDMSEEKQNEFILTIFALMQTVACIELGCDPISLALADRRGKDENKTGTSSKDMVDYQSFAQELISPALSSTEKEAIR